eukprot:15024_1
MPGHHAVTTPVQITNRTISIIGHSWNTTSLTFNHESNALFNCFNCHITFKDITITQSNALVIASSGNATMITDSVHITYSTIQWRFYDRSRVHFRNCTLSESNISYSIQNETNITFTRCQFIANQASFSSSFIQTTDVGNTGVINVHIVSTVFLNNNVTSILNITNTDLQMNSCLFDHNAAIYAIGSNINISSSTFSHCATDCIRSTHSSLHVQSSTFDDSAISFVINPMDVALCLTLVANNFSNAHAINQYGASLYIQGQDVYVACLNLVRNNFKSNDANRIYLDFKPNHALLASICQEDCSNVYSAATSFCIAIDVLEAEQCQNAIINRTNAHIFTFPGSCETLYIYAFDAFGHPLLSNHFNVFVYSTSEYMLVSNTAAVSRRNEYEQVIHITMLPQDVSSTNDNAIIIYNPNTTDPIHYYVNVSIQTCQSSQYKKTNPSNPGVYECIDCRDNEYTIDNGNCQSCFELEGVEKCDGGSDIIVKRNWFAKIEYDMNQSYLFTAACAPGYCCDDREGCPLNQPDSLCALNRDPTVKMCGVCAEGYSETLSGIGACANCNGIWIIILIGYVVVCLLWLFLLHHFNRKERRVSRPSTTYLTRSLLFFYQVYGFVTFRTFIKPIYVITENVNLIFGLVHRGTCLFPDDVTPVIKLYLVFIVPCILIFDLWLLKVYIHYIHRSSERQFKRQMISYYAVCDYALRIIHVQLTYACFRLVSCSNSGSMEGYVMSYAPNQSCSAVHWTFSVVFIVCIVFMIPWICYYISTHRNAMNVMFSSFQLNPVFLSPMSYREHCEWYYEMDLFRSGLLVSIPLLPGLSFVQRGILLMAASGIILLVHVATMPYRWRVNNYLETFILCIIFVSSVIQIFDDSVPDNVMIIFLFLPLFVMFIMIVLSLDVRKYCGGQSTPIATDETAKSLSTLSTRSGWKYRFELMEYVRSKWGHHFELCQRQRLHSKRKEMNLVIMFSNPLPPNTFFDAFALEQYLNDCASAKEYRITVKDTSRVINNDRQSYIRFECRWDTNETNTVVQAELMESFEDNEDLQRDILRTIKYPMGMGGYERSQVWTIVDLKLKGSISEQKKHQIQTKKYKLLMDNILEMHDIKKRQINQKLNDQHPEMMCLPLHRFTAKQLALKIKAWVYNDLKYREDLRKTMQTLANHGISGKRIISWGINDVKKIVESEFALFMTAEASNIVVEMLASQMIQKPQEIDAKTFAEIGWMLHHYPLDNLLKYIESERIDGSKFIDYYRTHNEWIKQNTGWNANDIYHINSILFRHHSLSKQEIEGRLSRFCDPFNSLKFKDSATWESIQSQLLTFDLEEVDLRIRLGVSVNDFSDFVSNMIDDLVSENQKKKLNSEFYDVAFDENDDEDIVKTIYDMIADVFVDRNTRMANRQRRATALSTVGELLRIDLNAQRDWVCYNCGNENFNQYIGGKMSIRLKFCTLCGIKEKESITMTLMNKDTFIMVRDVAEPDVKQKRKITAAIKIENVHDNKVFTVQGLIQHILELPDVRFDLSCLSRTDNDPCPSIMRLVQDMLVYKQWLDVLSDECTRYRIIEKERFDIDITAQADVRQFVDNEMFQRVFMDCAHCIKRINDKPDALNALEEMIDDSEFMNIDTFLETKRKDFADRVGKYTNNCVKLFPAVKLFTSVKNRLKTIAHQKEFGNFLSSLDVDRIDKDYHHIERVHINKGNPVTIENVFRFFELSLHFCDGESELVHCKSVKRAQARMSTLGQHVIEEEKEQKMEEKEMSDPKRNEKDIWSLGQYYMQSELDKMHTFLVHTDWEEYLKANKHKHASSTSTNLNLSTHLLASPRQTSQSIEVMDSPRSTFSARTPRRGTVSVRQSISEMWKDTAHTHKFITETSDKTKYGFGIEYSYIHLKPRFSCLRDELMQNTSHRITIQNYQNLLTKAIKKHRIALENDKLQLICKYFQFEYNIIRNQPIGIRHILAVIMYTDMSVFCTAFRATYRKINEKERVSQITARHTQLYWFSRFLFESCQFFGQEMTKKMRVYHGLSKELFFERFTAYFNIPISTTTSLVTAQQFSSGSGVILKLKHGVLATSVKPRYLSVSWLSVFPHEGERLFYGNSAFFEISDIIEAKNNKHHAKELKILNKFEKIINGYITWNAGQVTIDNPNQRVQRIKEKEMIDNWISLIQNQQGNRNISDYGRSLFGYLCNNENRKWICIKNFKSLPFSLKDALFIANEHGSGAQKYKRLSLIPMLRLFGYLQEIVLNDLNIKQLTEESLEYVAAVMHYVQKQYKNKLGTIGNYVQKIEFHSTGQFDGKQNSTLRKLAAKHLLNFKQFNWQIHYEFRLESTHCLVFTNQNPQLTKIKDGKRKSTYDHNDRTDKTAAT